MTKEVILLLSWLICSLSFSLPGMTFSLLTERERRKRKKEEGERNKRKKEERERINERRKKTSTNKVPSSTLWLYLHPSTIPLSTHFSLSLFLSFFLFSLIRIVLDFQLFDRSNSREGERESGNGWVRK